jgi:DNA polymerase (family X)
MHTSTTHEKPRINFTIAERLNEVARILRGQHANPFRARAYEEAARVLRTLDRCVSDILSESGPEGLLAVPGIGESIAQSIRSLVVYGRLPMLDRLRGESDPIALLRTVPGIGRKLSQRIHDELEIESLEELETAAHDGRLDRVIGIRGKRLQAIRDSLDRRLARVRERSEPGKVEEPPVAELLDIDREYREKASRGQLPTITPRRLNPERQPWLPILHTERSGRHYTAIFSNTPRAHSLGMTRDWVVLYYDGGRAEQQCTVITAQWGPLAGKQIVRGRETECAEYYAHLTEFGDDVRVWSR